MSRTTLAETAQRVQRAMAWMRAPEFLVFLPAITLAGFWIGGEKVLILLAVGLPLVFAMIGQPLRASHMGEGEEGSAITRALAAMDAILPHASETGRSTACLVVQCDDLQAVLERHGRSALTEVITRATDRIRGALRVGDCVVNLQGGTVAVALAPVRRLDLETMVQMAARLQEAVTAPIALGGAQLYITCSVGFCIGGRSPELTGRSMLDAAQSASDEALRHGPVCFGVQF